MPAESSKQEQSGASSLEQPENNPVDTGKATTPETGGEKAEDKGGKAYTEAEFRAEVDRRVTQAMQKAKEKHEAEAKSAREKLLAEQGEFKALAEEREKELAQLRAKAESLEPTVANYRKTVSEAVAARMKGLELSEAVKELLAEKDPLDQLSWISKHEESIKTQKKPLPDSPGTTPSKAISDEERRRVAASIRHYGA